MNIVRRVKNEDISEIEGLPSQSLSIVSTTGYTIAQHKREKKVNPKFIGLPWTPKGKSKCKRTRMSQISCRVAEGQYALVLVIDLMALNNETYARVFDAWYHKHLLVYGA